MKGKKDALCGKHVCPPLCWLSDLMSVTISFIRFMKFSVGVCCKHRHLRVSFVPTGSVTVIPYSVSTHTSNIYWLLRVKFGIGNLHKTLQGNTATHTFMFSLGYTHVRKFVNVLDNKCKVDVFAQQITGRQYHIQMLSLWKPITYERDFVIQ
jgi:hypothetical protein